MAFGRGLGDAIARDNYVIVAKERIPQRRLDAAAGDHAGENDVADTVRPQIKIEVRTPEGAESVFRDDDLVDSRRVGSEPAVPVGAKAALRTLTVHEAAPMVGFRQRAAEYLTVVSGAHKQHQHAQAARGVQQQTGLRRHLRHYRQVVTEPAEDAVRMAKIILDVDQDQRRACRVKSLVVAKEATLFDDRVHASKTSSLTLARL